MQTTYASTLTPAIKGMPVLAPRHSRPLMLAKLAQILRLTVTQGAGTTDLTLTLVDDKTLQSYSLTITGTADESDLGAAIRAAVAASPQWNSLVTVAAVTESDGSNVVEDFTARHPNRSYTLTYSGGPANDTGTASETQAPGGSGLEFGQLVARGLLDDEFAALSASTTVAQIAGFLFRQDANHYHQLPSDLGDEDPATIDTCERGVHYAIAEEGEFWVEVAEAVTPASRVFVRVEGSDVGDWGDNPAGTAQTATATVVADHQNYSAHVGIRFNGQIWDIAASYNPTDGTTATDDVVDGMEDAFAASITALGLASAISASAASDAATFVLTAAAGVEILYAYFDSFGEDTEAVGGTFVVTSADVDMLDVSAIARYTSSAAAGGLAKVKIQLQP